MRWMSVVLFCEISVVLLVGLKLIKVSKEMLNELFRYVCEDNFKYGLIFKITYVYGRNIGEILRLRCCDVDLKHNTLDFMLPTESVSFMLHDSVKEDLLSYIESNNLSGEDYIFISDDSNINGYSKKLNLYLKRFITDLNRNVLSWHCPILVNRDFKNLRGQHLFMDGADVKTVNLLYRNKNIQSTKDNISYSELLRERFPCDSLRKIFYEYTDLNVFVDSHFRDTELFTVCKDGESLILEFDFGTGVVNLLGDSDSKLYKIVSDLDFEGLFGELCGLSTGHYRFVNDLKIVKN